MKTRIDQTLCFIHWLIAFTFSTRPDELRDYCEEESFEAECPEGSAILIDRAFYGRMKAGRCILNEETGCRSDVQGHLGRWCSGRRHCTVAVTNLIRTSSGICSKDRRSYLEAMYTCVPVLRGQDGGCDSLRESAEITSSSGYISSYVTSDTGCGSLESPWQIRAAKGQRISVTLLDFSAPSVARSATVAPPPPGSGHPSDICTVYAIIKEIPLGQTITICGGKSREEVGFISVTNSIDIRLIGKRKTDDNGPKFMLHYQVIGCADPFLPPGSTLKRDDATAIVSCLPMQWRQWQLRCNGTDWIPDPTTGLPRQDTACDDGDRKSSASGDKETGVPLHFQGLSVVIVAAVTAMVGLAILLAGIGYLRRKKRLRKFPDRHCRLGPKSRSPGDGEWLGGTVHESSKQCSSDVMYLGSQSYVTSRWPSMGQGVTTTQIATALSPGVRSPPSEYGTATGSTAVLRFSEHLYESPNFERKDAPLLSSSLTRHTDAGTGRHCERDDACAVQGGRRSTTDAIFLAK